MEGNTIGETFRQEIINMKIAKPCGDDFLGRPIIVVSGAHLPDPNERSYDQILWVLQEQLEEAVESDYVIVFFDYGTSLYPALEWVRESFSRLPKKYTNNLANVYVVHPSFWHKAIFQMANMMISSEFFEKVINIQSLNELQNYVPVSHIYIPDVVREYDVKLSGGDTSSFEKPTILAENSQFGNYLSKLMINGNIPLPVKDSLNWIRDRGLKNPGIFRRSPPQHELLEAVEQYNLGISPDFGSKSIHLAPAILKKFFRDLASPFIPLESAYLLKGLGVSPASERLQHVKQILNELPVENNQLLAFVIPFLKEVSNNSNENQMTSANLGFIFGPNLIPPSMLLTHLGESHLFVQTLIENCDELYPQEKRGTKERGEESQFAKEQQLLREEEKQKSKSRGKEKGKEKEKAKPKEKEEKEEKRPGTPLSETKKKKPEEEGKKQKEEEEGGGKEKGKPSYAEILKRGGEGSKGDLPPEKRLAAFPIDANVTLPKEEAVMIASSLQATLQPEIVAAGLEQLEKSQESKGKEGKEGEERKEGKEGKEGEAPKSQKSRGSQANEKLEETRQEQKPEEEETGQEKPEEEKTRDWQEEWNERLESELTAYEAKIKREFMEEVLSEVRQRREQEAMEGFQRDLQERKEEEAGQELEKLREELEGINQEISQDVEKIKEGLVEGLQRAVDDLEMLKRRELEEEFQERLLEEEIEEGLVGLLEVQMLEEGQQALAEMIRGGGRGDQQSLSEMMRGGGGGDQPSHAEMMRENEEVLEMEAEREVLEQLKEELGEEMVEGLEEELERRKVEELVEGMEEEITEALMEEVIKEEVRERRFERMLEEALLGDFEGQQGAEFLIEKEDEPLKGGKEEEEEEVRRRRGEIEGEIEREIERQMEGAFERELEENWEMRMGEALEREGREEIGKREMQVEMQQMVGRVMDVMQEMMEKIILEGGEEQEEEKRSEEAAKEGSGKERGEGRKEGKEGKEEKEEKEEKEKKEEKHGKHHHHRLHPKGWKEPINEHPEPIKEIYTEPGLENEKDMFAMAGEKFDDGFLEKPESLKEKDQGKGGEERGKEGEERKEEKHGKHHHHRLHPRGWKEPINEHPEPIREIYTEPGLENEKDMFAMAGEKFDDEFLEKPESLKQKEQEEEREEEGKKEKKERLKGKLSRKERQKLKHQPEAEEAEQEELKGKEEQLEKEKEEKKQKEVRDQSSVSLELAISTMESEGPTHRKTGPAKRDDLLLEGIFPQDQKKEKEKEQEQEKDKEDKQEMRQERDQEQERGKEGEEKKEEKHGKHHHHRLHPKGWKEPINEHPEPITEIYTEPGLENEKDMFAMAGEKFDDEFLEKPESLKEKEEGKTEEAKEPAKAPWQSWYDKHSLNQKMREQQNKESEQPRELEKLPIEPPKEEEEKETENKEQEPKMAILTPSLEERSKMEETKPQKREEEKEEKEEKGEEEPKKAGMSWAEVVSKAKQQPQPSESVGKLLSMQG